MYHASISTFINYTVCFFHLIFIDPNRFRFTRQTTFVNRHGGPCTETSIQLWIVSTVRRWVRTYCINVIVTNLTYETWNRNASSDSSSIQWRKSIILHYVMVSLRYVRTYKIIYCLLLMPVWLSVFVRIRYNIIAGTYLLE